jgi:hypothetical protein
MKKIIIFLSEIIPFVLLLLFILYPSNFILLSNTILGKIIAIIITAFYIFQDILSGTLVGLIFVCFYQTDMVSKICKSEHFEIMPLPMMIPEEDGPAPATELFTDYSSEEEALESFIDPVIRPYENGNAHIGSSSINTRNRIKIQPESETIFKNQHCSKDLELTYNNQIITHPETIQMIYKELEFLNGKVCNPCDPTCSFSYSTSHNPQTKVFENQSVKERLGHTTKGNSLEETIAWATSWMVNKPEPFIGIGGGHNSSYV